MLRTPQLVQWTLQNMQAEQCSWMMIDLPRSTAPRHLAGYQGGDELLNCLPPKWRGEPQFSWHERRPDQGVLAPMVLGQDEEAFQGCLQQTTVRYTRIANRKAVLFR